MSSLHDGFVRGTRGKAKHVMHILFTLCLPRDEASVPIVRRICGKALRNLGVRGVCVDDIELAVTEACTNVLKHARNSTDEYEVTLRVDEQTSVIRVVDNTNSRFDHHSVTPEATFEPDAESGRGIYLMHALVDDLRFESKPEAGTVVRLEKELELEEGSMLGRLASA